MICFVVALPAEAGPLVRHYRLEPSEDAFLWYRRDDVALVVSGVGKAAAAAATAYLHARTGECPFGVWLNVGIAGHRSRPPGELVIAHTVSDAATGRRWYPVRLGGPRIDPLEVRTVDRAETSFDRDVAYEMEASGVFATALRWSTAELVHALKIVSDNRQTGLDGVTGSAVGGWIETHLGVLTAMADQGRELSSELAPSRTARVETLVDAYRQRWHFTTSETRRLRRFLFRWEALEPDGDHGPSASALERVDWGPDALRLLESRLRTIGAERPL